MTTYLSTSLIYEKSSLLSLVETAWTESAALAIQLFKRFPSARVNKDIRNLLLSYPEKAISSPEAVHFLLGDFMPDDISTQHRVYNS